MEILKFTRPTYNDIPLLFIPQNPISQKDFSSLGSAVQSCIPLEALNHVV